MNATRWQCIQEAFHAAADQRSDAAQLLGDLSDEEQAQVKAMLDAELELSSKFLEPPAQVRTGGTELPAGTTFDNLEILRKLGSGGMGDVYLARQVPLDRLVAVKLLRGAVDGEARQRLLDEAKRASKIRNDRIVRILGVGQKEGCPYFVMEYVPGETLAERLKKARGGLELQTSSERTLDPATSCGIVKDLAESLGSVHRAGLTHRDVKPQNVILDERGIPHLVDFGISRELDADTLTEETVGTPHYMSPEQARLRPDRIDERSDVFSLGVILYELLTLERPFQGSTLPEILDSIRDADPMPLARRSPSVPRDLATICEKALRKDPRRRYANTEELVDDLDRFLNFRAPLHASPPGLLERAVRKIRRHPIMCAVLLALLLAIPGTAFVSRQWHEREQRLNGLAELAAFETEADPTAFDVSGAARRTGEILQARETARKLSALHPDDDEVMQSAQRIASRTRKSAQVVMAYILSEVQKMGTAQELTPVLMQLHPLLSEEDRKEVEDVLARLPARLSVVSEPSGATVIATALNPATGQPLSQGFELGVTPVERPLQAGMYRLDLRGADGSSAELTTLISRPGQLHRCPLVHLRSSAEVIEDMVEIAPGPFQVSTKTEAPRGNSLVARGLVELGGFWVDRYEVSIGEYRSFLKATGRSAPFRWPADMDPTWDDLPVVGVDVYDAEAYAAWRGKRLLHTIEWGRLARLSEGGTNPWGASGSLKDALLNRDERLRDTAVKAPPNDWRGFVSSVRPVRSGMPSADGVLNLVGNVSEWTASRATVQVEDEVWGLGAGQRWVRGWSWRSAPLPLRISELIHAQATDLQRGFRCARSRID